MPRPPRWRNGERSYVFRYGAPLRSHAPAGGKRRQRVDNFCSRSLEMLSFIVWATHIQTRDAEVHKRTHKRTHGGGRADRQCGGLPRTSLTTQLQTRTQYTPVAHGRERGAWWDGDAASVAISRPFTLPCMLCSRGRPTGHPPDPPSLPDVGPD